MNKLFIPGALVATLLLWQQMWAIAALFAVLYVLLIELFKRLARYEKKFGDMDKIRDARTALRNAHENLHKKKRGW